MKRLTNIVGALVTMLMVFFDISLVLADKVISSDDLQKKDLEIQYLKRINLNISSVGVNRLNFGDTRIVKIVGDSSLYGLILSENGSDLFLTSKIAAPAMIDLTLILANNEAIDVRLHALERSEGVIVNVDIKEKNFVIQNERSEITQMISKMQKRVKGKYFVEEKKRLVNFDLTHRGDNNLVLNQYVNYRFGDLMGAGFNYSLKRIGNNSDETELIKEKLQRVFKNVLAVAIDRGGVKTRKKHKVESGKVFLVFKAGEELDV